MGTIDIDDAVGAGSWEVRVRPSVTYEVRVGELSLACHVRGRGPVCVVLPGTRGHHLRIPLVERELAMAYVGPAGPAASGADPSDGLRLEVGHLHAVVRSFGVEPVFVLGHARGAALSKSYARCHPDRVAGLILYATGPIADVRDDPPPLTVPTLVVTDRPDIDCATEPVDVLRHSIPDARLVTLPKSSHHAQLADPERFAHLLLEFTRRISGPVRTALT